MRHANVKNIEEYISRLSEMMTKKFNLFDICYKKDNNFGTKPLQ